MLCLQLGKSIVTKNNSNLIKRLVHITPINMAKKALLILAEGAEEMEAVISIDVMRRGGIDVTVAGLTGAQPVKCSRGVVVVPDKSLADAKDDYDVVVLPGGLGGANSLAASAEVGNILKQQLSSGKIIGAICAAPIALKSHQIALGKQITSYPSKKDELASSYNYSEDRVVVDDNLITSRGPGTAFEFGLKIVEKLVGIEKANEVASGMLVK